MSLVVYLNGQYLPYGEARVPVEDRGFLFGDGVYEVIKAYGGRPFKFREHLDRLAWSAAQIELALPDANLEDVALELLARNGLTRKDSTIYIQVTRGAAGPRTHYFPPAGTPPSVLVIVREAVPVPGALRQAGASAITHPDLRWGRCDIKSVNLLPNVLAKQAAVRAGAFEAILVRDGYAVEGSSSNLFVVKDGTIRTHPRGPRILSGITREAVIALAGRLGLPVAEEPVPLADLWAADEVFITSTTSEVVPVVRVDGRPVGKGCPGPVAEQLYRALLQEAGGEAGPGR